MTADYFIQILAPLANILNSLEDLVADAAALNSQLDRREEQWAAWSLSIDQKIAAIEQRMATL